MTTPQEISVPERVRPKDARPQSSAGWFGGMPSTEYRGAFVGKEIPSEWRMSRPASGPCGQAAPCSPHSSCSSQHPNLTNHLPRPLLVNDPRAAAEPIRVQRGGDLMPNAPFDGTTTNRTDFVPFSVPGASRAARPQPALDVERLPFAGQSTYADAFIPKEAPYEVGGERGGVGGGAVKVGVGLGGGRGWQRCVCLSLGCVAPAA